MALFRPGDPSGPPRGLLGGLQFRTPRVNGWVGLSPRRSRTPTPASLEPARLRRDLTPQWAALTPTERASWEALDAVAKATIDTPREHRQSGWNRWFACNALRLSAGLPLQPEADPDGPLALSPPIMHAIVEPPDFAVELWVTRPTLTVLGPGWHDFASVGAPILPGAKSHAPRFTRFAHWEPDDYQPGFMAPPLVAPPPHPIPAGSRFWLQCQRLSPSGHASSRVRYLLDAAPPGQRLAFVGVVTAFGIDQAWNQLLPPGIWHAEYDFFGFPVVEQFDLSTPPNNTVGGLAGNLAFTGIYDGPFVRPGMSTAASSTIPGFRRIPVSVNVRPTYVWATPP